MIFKNLGNSDVKISSVGLGLGGNFGKDGDLKSTDLIKSAFTEGINFFDTAEIYLDGHSEELLGKAVHKIRDKVVISSKFSPNHSKKNEIIKALDGSLLRLKSEYVDIYHVHWPSLLAPLEETMLTLETQVKRGKIRFIGVSNFSLKKIKRTLKALNKQSFSANKQSFSANNMSLCSVQNEYNFSERGAEADVLPFCSKKNITFIAYNPLGSGFPVKNPEQAKLLMKFANRYGKTNAQIVLNWLISKQNVVAIPGTTSIKHLKENVNSAKFLMGKKDLALFDKTFKQKISFVSVSRIKIYNDGKTYLSVEDAKKNIYSFVPSPWELAQEIKSGDFLKPIKLKKIDNGHSYRLLGGKIRFWGWVIAYDHKKPIPAVVE